MSEIEELDIGEVVEIPLEWVVPDDVPGGYANKMVVHHDEHEFVLYFFQLMKPIVLGTPEERRKKIREIKSIEAKCIAKITIAASLMGDFVDTLNENYGHYVSRFQNKTTEVEK